MRNKDYNLKSLCDKRLRKKKYCEVCEKETIWIFNPILKHSECSICGCRNIKPF